MGEQKNEGMATSGPARTAEKTTDVEGTSDQETSGFNWQWLWALLLIPLIGLFWKRRSSENTA